MSDFYITGIIMALLMKMMTTMVVSIMRRKMVT